MMFFGAKPQTFNKIHAEVLRKITPDNSLVEKAQTIIEKLQRSANALNIACSVEIGGSVAKNVYLKDDADCDFFIRYMHEKDISKTPLILKKCEFEFSTLHGSRDYFQAIVDQISCEFIPVLFVRNPKEAKNVTDMSPLHTIWANKHLTPKMKDDVRLMKYFCKANRLYGAESYIGGFSGHMIDILIVQYQSFLNVLHECQKWNKKTIIDVMDAYKNADIYATMNPSKCESAFIIVDPILPERNAASALQETIVAKLQTVAKQYCQKPSIEFFTKKPISLQTFIPPAYELNLQVQEGKTDIVGAKIKKIVDLITMMCAYYDFEITQITWDWDKAHTATICISLKHDPLAKEKDLQGPPLHMKQAVKRFLDAHSETFEKKNSIWARENRAIRTFAQIIDELQTDKRFLQRATSISITEQKKAFLQTFK